MSDVLLDEPNHRDLLAILDLAEVSAAHIDGIKTRLDKAQNSLFFMLTISLSVLAFSVFVTVKTPLSIAINEANILGIYLSFAGGVLVGAGMCYILFQQWRSALALRTELRVEVEIHARLMSLIDEQKRRLRDFSGLPAVARATIEMRMMRLYRTNR
jgi:hypothetical protein